MEFINGNDIPIEQFIADLRVVSHNKIVKNKLDWDPTSFRILEEPIDVSIITDLMGGPWTVSEVAEKYGLENKEIDDIFHKLIKHQDLLEIGYIARRVGWDERPGYGTCVRYTVKPVPFEARIYDPFFGFSLLDWKSCVTSKIELIPVDKKEFISVLHNLCEIWQMPLGMAMDCLEKRDTLCIPSILGPILFIEDYSVYEEIRHSLDESPELLQYSYFRLNFQNFINEYRTLNRPRIELMSIFDIQRYVIRLHDAIAYCVYFDISKVLRNLYIQKQMLFDLLFSTPTRNQ